MTSYRSPLQVESAALPIETLRAIVEQAGVGLCLVAPDLRVLMANQQWLESTGLTAEQALGHSLFDLFPETRDLTAAVHARARAGETVRVPRHSQYLQGKETWWEGRVSPIAMPGGAGTLVTARNVTAEVQAEAEREDLLAQVRERSAQLAGESERLHTLIDSIPDEVWFVDAQGDLTLLNEAARRGLGVGPGARPPRNLSEVLTEIQVYGLDGRPRPLEEAPLLRSLHGETVRGEEVTRHTRSGQVRYCQSSSAPLHSAKGEIVGAVAVVRDITAHRQVEKERDRLLQISETRRRLFEAIFSNIDAPITLLRGADLIHELVNPRWQALKPWKDMQGKPYRDVWPEFPEWDHALRDIMRSGTSFVARDAMFPLRPAPDAPPEERHFSVHIVPILDPESKERALLVLDIETTEEVRARHEVEAALRLRDEFLGVVAHELKTPITSLRGYAELTLKRLGAGRITDPREVHHAFETIDHQAERLSILTNQLLDLTGLESGELTLRRQATDLTLLVRGLVHTMQATTTRHTLTLRAPATLTANVDPERLRLVLYNLIDNAIKYSPEGGAVEVEVSAPDPETARIAVRDHGVGIAPARRPEIFTRFFRAAAGRAAGGLGLGLYIGQRLVALHGGRIWAEFPEDGGSRFVVELPKG